MRKIFYSILALSVLMTSCQSVPIVRREPVTKYSEPYKDFGTPLAGSYKNGEKVKAGLYIAGTIIALLSSLLFAPIQENGKGIIPIDENIGTPLSLSLLGVGVSTALIISPIDTVISYHRRNNKIMELNGIEFDRKNKLMKHDAIAKYREDLIKEEIEKYRIKFAEGSITTRDIYIIGSDEKLAEGLKIELAGYMKRKTELESAEETGEF